MSHIFSYILYSDVKRGQNAVAKAEAKTVRPRPGPEPRGQGRGRPRVMLITRLCNECCNDTTPKWIQPILFCNG